MVELQRNENTKEEKMNRKIEKNICIVYGKIVSEIEFKFIINVKKYYSIAMFQIELNNKSIVTVRGYNEIADRRYRNLSHN